MAQNIRVPSLLWKTPSGRFCLGLVDFRTTRLVSGDTREGVIAEMAEYLEAYAQENDTWDLISQLDDLSVRQFSVEVPPQYYIDNRMYNVAFGVRVRIPGVVGVQDGGGYLCSIPCLDLRFDFHSEKEERSLAQHFIKSALQHRTPRELATMYTSSDAELVNVTVRVREAGAKDKGPTDFESYAPLSHVAEPIVRGRGLRAKYPAAWEMETLAGHLLERLQTTGMDLLLVGEPGCGKTTIIADAALQLAEARGERAKPLCWRSSAHRLIAGMRYLGQWEERCEAVIAKLQSFQGILWMDNLASLLRVGGREPGSSVAAFLLPYMARGELRLIAEATPAELEVCRRLLPGFTDLFQIISVPRLGSDAVISILKRVAKSAAQRSKTEVEPGAELLHNRLHERFLPYEMPPGRVARSFRRLLDQTAENRATTLTGQGVMGAFSREAGLPLQLIDDAQPFGFSEALAFFQSKIIGQRGACETAARIVSTLKAGLNDPDRPISVLLFCGPTGVGKTALAKAVSECLFGAGDDKDRLIRLDMSEYSGFDAVPRLLGTPGGPPSALIDRVRRQPFQVILFDEIEKAAASIYDVLLNVCDIGRLRDIDGRETYFRSSILIMTSNLGVTGKAALGFGNEHATNYQREALRFFRPEFVNRIDEVVAFQPLGQDSVHAIAAMELRALSEREGLKEREIRLEWEDPVLDRVVAAGFDLRYGARPLQRAIEDLAVAPVALFLAQHPQTRKATLKILGNGTVEVS